jgi:hypothetical protein
MRTQTQRRKALKDLADARRLSKFCKTYGIARRTAYRVMAGGQQNAGTLLQIDMALMLSGR